MKKQESMILKTSTSGNEVHSSVLAPAAPLLPRVVLLVAGASLTAASPFLLGFLKDKESSGKTVLTVYADKLANGLPTVCDGLTRHVTSTPIVVGERWTEEQCRLETQTAVVNVQKQLAKCFKRAPNQMVFDMATSHAWNFGYPKTCSSLAMAAWNQGQWELGCRRLAMSDAGRPVWSYTCSTPPVGPRQCVFLQGLADRRNEEMLNCAEGAK